mgnify:CR=1 FL=1
MKLTKQQLKRLIKEELQNVLSEVGDEVDPTSPIERLRWIGNALSEIHDPGYEWINELGDEIMKHVHTLSKQFYKDYK